MTDAASQTVPAASPHQIAMSAAELFETALWFDRRGRRSEATRLYQALVERDPTHGAALHRLGAMRIEEQRVDEAIELITRAVAQAPEDAAAHYHLGFAYATRGRFVEAVAHYERALAVRPDFAEAHNNLGIALGVLGRHAAAVEHYHKAIAADPRHAMAFNNLGTVLRTRGDMAGAREAFARAVELAPKSARAYYNLVDCHELAADDPRLAAMRALAEDAETLAVDDQIELHFALGKALADVAQHSDSFRHLALGNALKRRQIDYDEAGTLALFDRIRAVFTRELMRQHRGAGDASERPVFIIGMPRSGTTLVEQILASHPAVLGAGELPNLAAAADRIGKFPEVFSELSGAGYTQIGAAYAGAHRAVPPTRQRITDKMPGNFLFAGLIHLALPRARIIHVRRTPLDTCFSCFSKLFTVGHRYTYDLVECGRYYRGYAALMEHWRQVLPEGSMLEIDYETVVADIEGSARRLIAHCGLEWSDACLDFHRSRRPVHTISAAQVRRPLYQSAVGRAQPYGELLRPLLEALEAQPELARPFR